jgi:hypothetical protein
MKRFFVGLAFFLFSTLGVSGDAQVLWQRDVASGRYRGDVYSLTKTSEAFCSVEFADKGDFVFLLAKSPIIDGEMYITTKLIMRDHSEVSAAIFNYRTLPDGTKQFVTFRFIDPTAENDVFNKECVDEMKNGAIVGPEGKLISIPGYVKNAFRGEYGILAK